MIQHFHRMISAALGISEKQIVQTLGLLNDGATIPFISRYRKEVTGGLDEVQIESIKTHYEKLNEIAKPSKMAGITHTSQRIPSCARGVCCSKSFMK